MLIIRPCKVVIGLKTSFETLQRLQTYGISRRHAYIVSFLNFISLQKERNFYYTELVLKFKYTI